MLGVSARKVYELAASGQMPSYRISSRPAHPAHPALPGESQRAGRAKRSQRTVYGRFPRTLALWTAATWKPHHMTKQPALPPPAWSIEGTLLSAYSAEQMLKYGRLYAEHALACALCAVAAGDADAEQIASIGVGELDDDPAGHLVEPDAAGGDNRR